MLPRNKLATIFTGALYQILIVRKQTEGTVGLKTTSFNRKTCVRKRRKTPLPSALQTQSKTMGLNLYKYAEPLRSFPKFCRTPFLPNITESKNGLHVADDLVGSVEP